MDAYLQKAAVIGATGWLAGELFVNVFFPSLPGRALLLEPLKWLLWSITAYLAARSGGSFVQGLRAAALSSLAFALTRLLAILALRVFASAEMHAHIVRTELRDVGYGLVFGCLGSIAGLRAATSEPEPYGLREVGTWNRIFPIVSL